MEALKRCPLCGQDKPHGEFHRNRSQSDGLTTHCKSCRRSSRNAGQEAKSRRAWMKAYPIKRLIYSARCRAKARGLTFRITEADISIPSHCPVLGIPLSFGEGARHEGSPTLDRIRSSQGYEPGNVIVVSFRANRIKNDGTPEEHRRIADFYDRL